jgi:hypothetical protein
MAIALLESIEERAGATGLSKASPAEREVTLPGNLGKTTVRTPLAWDNPQGDAKVEGVLRNVECRGTQARLLIDTGASDTGKQTVTLVVADPGRVVWRNAPGGNFQLACGAQKPVRVLVEFKQASGEITAIEFR